MAKLEDRPNIIMLPPLLVGGVLLIGIVLHYWLWTIEPLPVIPARLAGLLLYIASGILAHTAHRAFQRVGTNVFPTQPAIALALDGPYRRTRNPLYIAALGVYLGVALWVDALVPILLLPVVAAGLHWGIVKPEERYLEEKFGQQYTEYRARVPRWL